MKTELNILEESLTEIVGRGEMSAATALKIYVKQAFKQRNEVKNANLTNFEPVGW